MNKDREYLEKLVKQGQRFRRTPIVDDDFIGKKESFDILLFEAEEYLEQTKNQQPIVTLNTAPQMPLVADTTHHKELMEKTKKAVEEYMNRLQQYIILPQRNPLDETPTMAQCQAMVKEFHIKHEIPHTIVPGQNPKADMIRAHLITEELGELELAIADNNIVKIADALADLIYVVLGVAVTYGLPAQELFLEVQRSNMTKASQKNRDIRIRDKGPCYSPPNIQRVLRDLVPWVLGIDVNQQA